MTDLRHVALTGWQAPDLRRDPPPQCRVLRPEFWAAYDSTTIAYDAQYDPADRRLRLYCPRLFNLAAHLKAADLRADGTPLRLGRIRSSRHLDIAEYRCAEAPRHLTVGDRPLTCATVERAPLTGARALITMSRDNDLTWIADWVRFHQRMHGTDTLILSDTGSTAYSTADLAAALAPLGLAHLFIVAAPFRFGPLNPDSTNRSRGDFLQPCLLTLLRDRFLSRAAGILVADVDELVVPRGRTIYDALQSPLGHLTFPGVWRYPAPDEQTNHRSHRMQRPGDAPCPTKYALRPTGPLGRRPMQVHHLGGVPRRLIPSGGFYYLHCNGISNSWKYDRSRGITGLAPDADTARILDEGFAA